MKQLSPSALPRAHVLLQRSYQALTHLNQAKTIQLAALKQFQARSPFLEGQPTRIHAWSPPTANLIIELSAALASLRTMQNEVLALATAAIRARNVPSSLREACNAMSRHQPKGNRRPRWLAQIPDEHKSLFVEYWLSQGKRLADYRDVDQHFDVLARQCFLDCLPESFSRLWVCLPDNPEVKSPAQFTYNNEIDAVQFAGDAFHRLHHLSEDLAKKSGAGPQFLERTIMNISTSLFQDGGG